MKRVLCKERLLFIITTGLKYILFFYNLNLQLLYLQHNIGELMKHSLSVWYQLSLSLLLQCSYCNYN